MVPYGGSVSECTELQVGVTWCFNLPAVPLLQTPPLNWRLHMSNLQRESQQVHLNLQGKSVHLGIFSIRGGGGRSSFVF